MDALYSMACEPCTRLYIESILCRIIDNILLYAERSVHYIYLDFILLPNANGSYRTQAMSLMYSVRYHARRAVQRPMEPHLQL